MFYNLRNGVILAICLALLVSAVLFNEKILPLLDFQRVVTVKPRVQGEVAGKRVMPTHVFFDENEKIEVLSDFNNNRFVYRSLDQRSGEWLATELDGLKKPHAVAFDPNIKKYYGVDTSRNRIVSFRSFDDAPQDVVSLTKVNDVAVGKRPHDIAYNPVDNFVYVVLSNGVLRFMESEEGVFQSDFLSLFAIRSKLAKHTPYGKVMVGYMRSLSIINGVLYLSNSTRGNIIQITDFDEPSTWVVHSNDKQPNKSAEKGVFDKDGLVPNDVEYYKGYWYATNYYPGNIHNYISHRSVSKNKFIRWKTWGDFKNSKWEDLSHLVHGESIPYYFTIYDDRLFLSMFHGGNQEGEGSGIFEIKTSLF